MVLLINSVRWDVLCSAVLVLEVVVLRSTRERSAVKQIRCCSANGEDQAGMMKKREHLMADLEFGCAT